MKGDAFGNPSSGSTLALSGFVVSSRPTVQSGRGAYYLIFSVAFYVVFFIIMRAVLANHSLLVVTMVDLLMIPASLMWGVMAHAVFYIHFFMKEICGKNLRVDIFDPDGFGGLGTIGKVAIRVTAFISSASLYIPFGLTRTGAQSAVVASVAVLGIVGLMFAMAATFLLTVLPVSRLAKKRKAELLKALGNNLSERLEKFGREDVTMEKDIELLLALESYREVRAMRVWPFDSATVFNIFCFLLLPVILFALGSYV